MERLPKMAAKTKAHVGSDHDKREQVEGDGADGVVEGLGWRMDRIDEVEDAKGGSFAEEQDHRMEDGNEQRDVAGPVVDAEIIEAVMRPGAMRAVAEGHQQAQQHGQGDGADSGEAYVSREVEDGDAHGRRGGSIGPETVEKALTFHGVDGKSEGKNN